MVRRGKQMLDVNKERALQSTTGNLREPLWVYRRDQAACRRCGTSIRVEMTGVGGPGARDVLVPELPACVRRLRTKGTFPASHLVTPTSRKFTMRPQLAILTLLSCATMVLAPVPAAHAAPARCDGDRPTIVGTAHADRLVGTTGSDVIFGGGGADVIIGLGGNDRLCGGDGNDRIEGGTGRDTLNGGDGDDRVEGNQGIDSFFGDGCDAADGVDVYAGGPDKDKFEVLCQGSDRITGGAGNDQITISHQGTSGLRASGGPGDDIFRIYASSSLNLAGGSGHDSVTASVYTELDGQRVTFDHRVGEITTSYSDAVARVRGFEATVGRFLPMSYVVASYFHGTPGDDEFSVSWEPPAQVAFGYGGDDVFRTASADDTLDGGAGHDEADAGARHGHLREHRGSHRLRIRPILTAAMSSRRWTGRNIHEAAAHGRGRQEPEHPGRAGRPPWQTDRRVEGPLHPHGAVRAPTDQS